MNVQQFSESAYYLCEAMFYLFLCSILASVTWIVVSATIRSMYGITKVAIVRLFSRFKKD